MKLSVSRETFLARLSIVARAASTRSAIQTLAGVLIKLEDGRAELQATDTDLGIRAGFDAEIAAEGSVVVPGRLLLDVARSLPKSEVSLEYRPSEQDVEVISGSAKFHLRTLPLEDFPKLPEPDASSALALPAPAFVETIGRVARSASRDETRPHLTGVLVTAERRGPADGGHGLLPPVRQGDEARPAAGRLAGGQRARPGRSRSSAASWATDGDEQISVTALENQVVFSAGDVVLSSRLVDGRFPNYQQLLPEAYEHELRIDRGELVEVVRRISLLAQKNAPLRLSFTEGALEISAQTPDVGEASESLPVPFAGEPLEIGFNPEFFRDGLESAETDELVLKLISPLRPGLIQSGDDGGFIYLVMPIRLNV